MRVWLLLALVVAGALGVWWGLGRIQEPQVWIGLVLGVWALGGAMAYGGFRRRLFAQLTLQDYILAAMFIGLLYVAVLPWRLGLGKVPIIHPFIYAIPFTAVLIIGIRLVPKPGAVTLMLFGEGLLYQLLGSGLNPLWWPDFLLQALVIDSFLLFTRDYAQTLKSVLAIGLLRGVVGYLYFYFIGAPFIWHTFYGWWYVAMQISLGATGSLVGAAIGLALGRKVEAAFRFGGI